MATSPKSEIIEAEVVNRGGTNTDQHFTYVAYGQKPSDPALVGVWIFGIISLFMSIIPVIGWFVALLALFASMLKKVPPILPVIALVISSVITGLFMFIWLVLKAIF